MSSWARVKIFFCNILNQDGAAVTATSTASGDFSADYLLDSLETKAWMAANKADPHYITLDTGPNGALTEADSLIIHGHNLGKASASVTLEYSDNGADFTDAFQSEMLKSDQAYLKEFSSPGSKRYWRLKITGHKEEPWISVLYLGPSVELDYASSSYDPHGQEASASVNLSYGGYVAGIHTAYIERSIGLKFADASLEAGDRYLADGAYKADGTITADGSDIVTLWDKVRRWWETSGMANFFVALDTGGASPDVYLVRPDAKFSNPLKYGGRYRDITLNLKGRRE